MNEENLVEKFINCLVSDEDKSAEFGNKADDFKEFKDKNKLLLDFLKDKNYYEIISLMTEVYVCDACKNKENENLNMEGHNREKIVRKIDLPVVIKSNDQNLIEKIEEFLKGFEDFLNELEQKKKQEIQKMRKVMQKIRSLLRSNNIYNSKWVIVISQNPNPIKDKEKYKYDSFEYNDKFQIGSVFGLGHLIYDLKNSEERKIPEVLGFLIMLGLWPKYNLYFTDAVKCFYEKKLGQRIIKNCWDKVLSKEIKEIIKKFSGVEKILLFGDVAKNNYERIIKEININEKNIICLPHPQGQGTPYYSNTISIINELKEKFGFKKIEDKIDGFWILKQKIFHQKEVTTMPKICNTCGATNPDDATVCSECGMDLTTVQQTQATVVQKPEETQQPGQEIHPQAEIISSSTSATTPKPKAKLIKKSAGGLTTEEFVIYGTDVVIGRFSSETGPVDIDLSNIPEANYVSRKHCRIYEKNGVWYIKDLGSTNGVFVNRKKISDETQLNDGDEVALGNALFVFKIETEK